jgi:hypothetical protein
LPGGYRPVNLANLIEFQVFIAGEAGQVSRPDHA